MTASAGQGADLPLPLWRLITGLAVLGGFVVVMILLAPVYIDNYQLQHYVRELASAPSAATTPDDGLRAQVITRAHELDLPVLAGDIHVTHDGGKPHLEMRYKVKMTFYPVDLHMSAASR